MDGIYVMFCGGLGNRMFQVAAGYAASRKYKCALYIPSEPIKNHHGDWAIYSENIFKYLGIHLDTIEYPQNKFRNDVYQFMISTEAYSNDHLQFPVTFNQYFQYYPPLQLYEEDLRMLFKKGLMDYLINYSDLDNAAFIHIRRGDYLNYPDRHPITTLSYYQHAMNELKEVSVFYVFSDDIEWVQQQPLFQSNKVVCVHSTDELYTLAFMSKCQAGAICANSSFSWWGAFLGAYEKRKPVFVPRDWIRNRVDGLFPPEWIVV
jgi:hypothetical protein